MKKYYIGFLVLTALVVGLLGYTLYQGGMAKQDKKLQKQAVSIADDLNEYIREENKIPGSLEAAGIDDVPSQIEYKRLSDERYEFCVTYKTTSLGYTPGTWEVATLALAQSYYGQYDSSYSSDYESSSLYIYEGAGHKKGRDCQKIKPYLSSAYESDSDSLFESDSTYCDPSYEYYEFYKEYCADADDTETDDTQVN